MIDTPKNEIKIEDSENVSILINDIESYEAHVKRRLDKLSARLTSEHSNQIRANTAEHQLEINQLQTQISEYQRRLANPQAAYDEYIAKIAELEQLLQEATIEIGENHIMDAQAAIHAGDYTKADDIFAEVEELEHKAVKRASKAAYGRGLVAEVQVRWADAATHYSNAARLDPSYDTLIKAGEFLWRAGLNDRAVRVEEDLVALSRQTYGESHEKTATALNNLASSLRAVGNLKSAEPLFRQALEIDAKTIGMDHPDYAIHLNNLAGLLRAMGDYTAAEPLFRQAVSVMEAALGAEHPNSKTLRNNFEAFLRDKP